MQSIGFGARVNGAGPQRRFLGYRALFRVLCDYWVAYGGWASLLSSPYFHLSFVGLAVSYPRWSAAGWWLDVIGLIPGLLGFSIGGYAILLAFGNAAFVRDLVLFKEQDGVSGYLRLSSTFLHYILMLSASLVFALGCSWYDWLFGFSADWIALAVSAIGYLAFIYGLLLMVALAVTLFRFSRMLEAAVSHGEDEASLRDENAAMLNVLLRARVDERSDSGDEDMQ